MRKYAIVTDSSSDLKEEFQKKYDIIIINSHITLPDGKDTPAYLEWKDISRDDFYSSLKSNPTGFSTAPPNLTEFENCFKAIVKDGYDIIALTLSGGISSSYNTMVAAGSNVMAQYPESTIKCIDTRKFGPSVGLLCLYASIARSNGLDLNDAYKYVEDIKSKMHQSGWLDDLSFVARKGRISHSKALLGTLAGIKPLGDFDSNGLTSVIGKVKGTKKALNVALEYINRTITDAQDQIIFIAQTNRLPQAEIFKQMIEEKIKPKEVYVNDVFPFCGINVGPGLMAAYYIGKPLTDDLSEERAIMDSIISEE